MKSIKGTETEKNLLKAFAGESEAVSYTHLEKTDWQIIENICECFLAELISNFMIYNKYNLIFNQL